MSGVRARPPRFRGSVLALSVAWGHVAAAAPSEAAAPSDAPAPAESASSATEPADEAASSADFAPVPERAAEPTPSPPATPTVPETAPQPPPEVSAPQPSAAESWSTPSSLEVPPVERSDDVRFLSIAAFLTYGDIWGNDFDGQTFVAWPDGSEVGLALVPELRSSTGISFEACFGAMRPSYWGFWLCLAYARSYRSGTFAGAELGEVVSDEGFVPIRVMFRADNPVRPYLDMSVGFGRIAVENGAAFADIDGNLVGRPGDAVFAIGASFGLGLGAVFFLADQVGFDVRFGYRAYAFSSVNDIELEDDLGAGAYELRLGPALYF